MISVNDKCIALIQSFEGLELKPYHGAADRPDVFTIGYGTIQYPPDYLQGRRVSLNDPPITEALALQFLQYEVSQRAEAIADLLRNDLAPNQFGALVSFAYNLGLGSLKESTLRLKVNADPSDPVIRDEFMRWVFANGKPVEGLRRRRQAEADLYFTL